MKFISHVDLYHKVFESAEIQRMFSGQQVNLDLPQVDQIWYLARLGGGTYWRSWSMVRNNRDSDHHRRRPTNDFNF